MSPLQIDIHNLLTPSYLYPVQEGRKAAPLPPITEGTPTKFCAHCQKEHSIKAFRQYIRQGDVVTYSAACRDRYRR